MGLSSKSDPHFVKMKMELTPAHAAKTPNKAICNLYCIELTNAGDVSLPNGGPLWRAVHLVLSRRGPIATPSKKPVLTHTKRTHFK